MKGHNERAEVNGVNQRMRKANTFKTRINCHKNEMKTTEPNGSKKDAENKIGKGEKKGSRMKMSENRRAEYIPACQQIR